MNDRNSNIGAACDWLAPVCRFIQDRIYGPSARISVALGAGYIGTDISQILGENNIKTWGWSTDPETSSWTFRTRKEDAEGAYYLLRLRGYPAELSP